MAVQIVEMPTKSLPLMERLAKMDSELQSSSLFFWMT
jgi:hypothetical protein